MCGEKTAREFITYLIQGSPPRMRGRASSRRRISAAVGITPAYAGKSYGRASYWQSSGDHPRVCGEEERVGGKGVPRAGSPPRMRGRDSGNYLTTPSSGITPAYAGKSFRQPPHDVMRRDHPRVCGEEVRVQVHCDFHGGSPPRMRGRVDGLFLAFFHWRITPAYAGKRFLASVSVSSRRDHPRVCGEEAASKAIPSNGQGSPPRMRGRGCVIHFSCPPYGITPAYAGKRGIYAVYRRGPRDHPRVCGEEGHAGAGG